MVRHHKQAGFTLVEITVALLLLVILLGIAILAVTGFFSHANKSAMEADLDNVKSAVDNYMIASIRAQ